MKDNDFTIKEKRVLRTSLNYIGFGISFFFAYMCNVVCDFVFVFVFVVFYSKMKRFHMCNNPLFFTTIYHIPIVISKK